MRKILLSTIGILLLQTSFSQNFSNKGKEFFLSYSYHVGMIQNTSPVSMTLYITSNVSTTYNVEIFGGAVIQSGSISANQVISVDIPDTYFINNDGMFFNKAIHVTAAKPVVVYSYITRNQASAATLCLPVSVLGKQYYGISFNQFSNENNSNSFITIIGVEDNTTVEIIPTVNTKGGWPAGSVNVINLNKGEIYQVLGTTSGFTGGDLSGTSVRSIASGTGACKRIAVFSGSGKITIGCPANNGSSDNLYQQLYPTASWGKKYLTAPSFGKINNYYRVLRSDPATILKVNGVVIPDLAFTNNYYQFYNGTPNIIEASLPVSVTQYFTSQGCPASNPVPYDPDMVVLNPVEQNIDSVTLISSNLTVTGTHEHNVHVIIPNKGTGISSFRFDNNLVSPSSWNIHPGDPNYSYLYLPNVAETSHSLASDSGFNALAYGYGNAETYAYSAGTNVKDLYQQIGVSSQYGIETSPSVCTGSPFKFKISLPYQADSIYWDLSPTFPAVFVKPVFPATVLPFDSTTFVNGKQIWWYSLPTSYTYTTVGTYPITITTYTNFSDGCGNSQEIPFDLEVSGPPLATFSTTNPRCVAETVQFTENTTSNKPIYKWYWDFGDPGSGANNTSSLKTPTHLFSAPGTYNIRYANINTAGCLSDTIPGTVIVAPLPTANIAGTITVCQNAASPNITFTGSGGSAPYTFTYNINGGPSTTVTTSTGNTITVAVPTITTGTFRYNLLQVQNTGSTLCTQVQAGFAEVIVRPLPAASITGTTTVCQNAASPNIIFTGSSAVAPYTFTYSINGGAPISVTTTTGNTISLPVSTATPGTFTYNLLTVTDGSTNSCSNTVTGSAATVIVNALPVATISGSTAVCQNSPAPNITFTGSGAMAPYTFTYNINGGAPITITTSAGNSISIPAPTGATGTFVYTVTSIRDGSGSLCGQVVTGVSASVIVNPLPTGTITGTSIVCQDATPPVITFTGAGTIAPYTFTYTINGGGPANITTATGNSITIPVSTTTPGTYIYNLTSVKDGSTTQCSRLLNASVTIVVRPLPAATIAGTTTVCQNAPSPTVTFTGSGATAPYRFTYNINGGATLNITSTGNVAVLTVPANIAGTYTYNLLSVTDASNTLCSQTITGASAIVTVRPLPTATIAGTAEQCLNTPSPNITFTGTGGTVPYTFTYTINGGAVQTITGTAGSSTASLTVPTGTAGLFTYNLLSVKDANAVSCSQAQSGAATVRINPLPLANFVYTIPSCETRSISFNPNSSVANAGTINGWQWNFGDAASGADNTSTAQFPVHNFSTAGSYFVSLIVTTDKGCSNTTFTKTVVISPQPKAGFILPEVCLTDPFAKFTDTSKLATAWEWNFGDPNATPANPNISTAQNPTHKYTAVGTYNVRQIAISASGCRDTLPLQQLTINGGNPVAAFNVLNPAANCANDSVSIQNKSTIASGNITRLEIYWDNSGVPTVFDADEEPLLDKVYKHRYPDFQSPAVKTYNVRIKVFSGGTCFTDIIRSISVNASPKITFAKLPDGCLNVPSYPLTQAVETAGLPGTSVYSGPGVVMVRPGIYNFNSAIAGVGTHIITYVFTSASGCIDSAKASVSVFANPTVNAGPDVIILAGGSTTLQPTATGENLRYLWLENKYLNDNRVKNPVASPPEDMTYTLTVTASGGCTAEDKVSIRVLLAPKIPNTFSPNNDGINDKWLIDYLDTYPNSRIQVFTRTGKLVFESRGYRKPWDGNVNGKSLPVDTYYYIIEPESGRKPITGYVTIIK